MLPIAFALWLGDGARYRVRTCQDTADTQGLAPTDAQIAAHDLRKGSEISEVVEAWADLPSPLRAAVLAIVRSQTGPRITLGNAAKGGRR